MHYRIAWPADVLRGQGHDVTVMPPREKSGFLASVGRRDDGTEVLTSVSIPHDAEVIVLQRPAHRLQPQMIELMRANGIAVVVDVDDDLASTHPSNKAYDTYFRGKGDVHWRHMIASCKAATLVTCSTRTLARRYAPHGRFEVLDNYVPEAYLDLPVTGQPSAFGWAGTLQSHPNDLQVLGTAVRELVAEGHEFVVVGDGKGVKDVLRLPYEPTATGFVKLVDWAGTIGERMRVGLVPLDATAFNSAKCVDSKTRIATDRGVLLAGDLKPGMRVWSDGWRHIEDVEKTPIRSGFLITAEYGYQVKLTPEHRMMVNGTWTEASRICVGDIMTMAPECFAKVPLIEIPWPADSRMTGSHRSNKDDLAYLRSVDGPRLRITSRWGRILGAFAGDGSVQGKTQLNISCDGIDQDWIDLLSDDFRSIGLHPSTQERTMYDGTILRRRCITVASAHLLRVFDQLGIIAHRDSGKPIRRACVPNIIWVSPKEVVAEFLAGYFEADGTVPRRGTGVSATSKSRDLIVDVQRLLLLFGIESSVKPKIGRAQNGFQRNYWQISLNRAATDIFAKEIGFRSKRKQGVLSTLTGRPHSNAYRPMTWSKKVISIEPCEINPVDIQVEGEEFVLTGFVSHNSRLKGIEMMAVGVPWTSSPREEYRKLHQEAGCGLLADTPKQWARAVRRLLTDEALYKEQVEAGRAYMRTQTYQANAWRWAQAWQRAYDIQRGVSR